MAGTATPATKLLVTQRIDHTVHSYAHDERAESYGSEAVDALGETVGVTAHQVFKTLVIKLDTGKLAVAVLPVPEKLSLKAAAAALGAGKAVMADRTEAERSTGYVFGGISPLGQRKHFRRSSTRRRSTGTGCCAARAGADSRSNSHPPIWCGSAELSPRRSQQADLLPHLRVVATGRVGVEEFRTVVLHAVHQRGHPPDRDVGDGVG